MQDQAFSLPLLKTLSREQAQAYQKNLSSAGLLDFLPTDRPMHYGHLIELPLATVRRQVEAAEIVEQLIVGYIRQQGLTNWLDGHAPYLGPEVLNYPLINRQLEKRVLEQGYLLGIAYDGFVVVEHGRPRFRVVEIQTAIGHAPAHRALIQAAGRDPDIDQAWYGPENPQHVLHRMQKELAQGEPVTIIDTDPYSDAGQIDQTFMARALGDARSLPVAAIDIEHDPERGYFYYQYAVQARTGLPIPAPAGEGYLKTTEKRPIKHVLARMIQPDLDMLSRQLEKQPERRKLLTHFFGDEQLNWLHHPAWQYIIDKSTLPLLRRDLERLNHPAQHDFVPVYGAGERVPHGRYIRKPVNDAKHEVYRLISVAKQAEIEVESGYIYQEFLQPYPVPAALPADLEGSFPMPRELPTSLRDELLLVGWGQQVAASTVELRAMALPWGREHLSMYFLGRVAPRYQKPDTHDLTLTNIRKLRKALFQYLDEVHHSRLPFGWCPIIIERAGEATQS